MKKIILFVALFMLISPFGKAQFFDELNARPAIGLGYRATEKLNLSTTWYVYLNENLSHYDKSVIAAMASYRMVKPLQASIDFRYGLSNKGNYFDIRYILALSNKSWIDKWTFRVQPTIQQVIKQAVETNYTLWSLVSAEYKVNSLLAPYIFTEPYHLLNNNFEYTNHKSAVGVDITPNKHHLLKVQMTMFNRADGINQARPELVYRYYIR